MQFLKKPNKPSTSSLPLVICKTDEQIAANELLCLLWDLWEMQLPKEIDIELAFPKEYKKALLDRLADLKREQFEILKELRELKNSRQPTENLNKQMEHISTIIKRLEWKLKPPTGKEGMDLENAKRIPIPNFIEFKRNLANCIWHSEKSPSMKYSPERNRVYCFGCNNHGDAIDVVMILFNLDIKEAIRKLNG